MACLQTGQVYNWFATATYLREWNQLSRHPCHQENSAHLEGDETFISQTQSTAGPTGHALG